MAYYTDPDKYNRPTPFEEQAAFEAEDLRAEQERKRAELASRPLGSGAGVLAREPVPATDFTKPLDLSAADAPATPTLPDYVKTGSLVPPSRDQSYRRDASGRVSGSGSAPIMAYGKGGLSAAQEALDTTEKSYNENPAKFEADRMAQPPASGEIRYKLPNGEWKSYNAGPSRADVSSLPGIDEYKKDRIFGQERANVPADGGSVSFTGGSNDAEAYRRYKANGMGDEALAQEDARTALARTLAADPFAKERTEAGLEVGKQTGIAAGQSGVRTAEQGKRREAYLSDAEGEHQIYTRNLLKAHGNPALTKDVQERYAQRLELLKQAYGFGGNISNSEIYKQQP